MKKFTVYNDRANSFFEILPVDWQEGIVPYWENYKKTTTIYVLEENNQIRAGGLVFSECPPDMEFYKNEALEWFEKGYLYLGFLWVPQQFRNQNLGSLWLNSLKEQNENQKYWLTIEEDNLRYFYEKNNFIYCETIINELVKEDVLFFNGKK
jgi:GNAT superfamily N-acetyltransferase